MCFPKQREKQREKEREREEEEIAASTPFTIPFLMVWFVCVAFSALTQWKRQRNDFYVHFDHIFCMHTAAIVALRLTCSLPSAAATTARDETKKIFLYS